MLRLIRPWRKRNKNDTLCVPVLSPFSHFLTLGFSRAFLLYRLVRFSVPFHFFSLLGLFRFSNFRVFAHFSRFSSLQIFEFSAFRQFFRFFVLSDFEFSGFRSFFTLIVFSNFRGFRFAVPVCTFLIFAFSDFCR